MNLREIQRQWQAVFQPEREVSMAAAERVRVPDTRLPSIRAAWWLAQCCHVTYLKEADQRREVLAGAGLMETTSYSKWALHWSRIEGAEPDGLAIIAFRGSSDLRHWLFNANSWLSDHAYGGKVHRGFQQALGRIIDPLREELESRPPREICFTGHSLGGALAVLAATEWPVGRCYTFGSPRIGNEAFVQQIAANLEVTRVVHGQDLVTALPEQVELVGRHAYHHAGEVLHVTGEGAVTTGEGAQATRVKSLMKDSVREIISGRVGLGAPLPALLDHAPEGYVRALRMCLEAPEGESGS